MDAVRRRKETGLIRQLERWTSRDREQRKAAPRSGLIRRDQGRVAVLQDSVDLISRLEDLNAALTSACNAQEERVQTMAAQLQIAIHRADTAAKTAAAADTDTAEAIAGATTTPTPAPASEFEAERQTELSLHHSASTTTLTIPLTTVNRVTSSSSSASSSSSSSPPSPVSSSPSPSSTSPSPSLSHPLSLLPSRVSDVLSYLSARHSLYSSLLGDSSLRLLLVDSATGIGLDANDAYFAHSHFSRHQLTHTLITAPYTYIMDASPPLPLPLPQVPLSARPGDSTPSPPAAKRRKGAGKEGKADVVRKEGVGQVALQERGSASGEYVEHSGREADEVAQGVPQWPRSLREMRRLYAGEVGVVQCVWRCRLADGLVREQQWVSWVAKRDAVVDQLGRVTQQPVHTVYAAGFDDAHVVQRWHSLTA